jgi:predicted transglutaminase-like cysteine proteinase
MTERRRSCRVAVLLLGAALAYAALAQSASLGFTTSVSEKLIRLHVARFGEGARQRIVQWQDFPRTQRPAVPAASPDQRWLVVLNGFFNRMPFVSDISHWRVEDYWASPSEFFASDGGDCEDFSVAKYFMLKELGVPIDKLRITYVQAKRLNQAHMVVAYYPTPEADPLILDNLENTVRPASQRTDLVPVYSFNDDELWLAQRGRAGSSAQIRMWRELLQKLEREART